MEFPEYTGKTGTRNANYIYKIYTYISEISIDMNRECARFSRSIMASGCKSPLKSIKPMQN